MRGPLGWPRFVGSTHSHEGAAIKNSYVRIDAHKKWCVFAETDSTGNVLRQGRFGNSFDDVSKVANSLSRKVPLVLEPVLNYPWLLDQSESYVGSVHVAAPHKVRVIAVSKSKTDRYDARMLAELLQIHFLPESWIPPAEIRLLRGLVRQQFRSRHR